MASAIIMVLGFKSITEVSKPPARSANAFIILGKILFSAN